MIKEKKIKEAVVYFDECLAAQIELYGEGSKETANVYYSMGKNYAQIKNYEKSLEYFEKV